MKKEDFANYLDKFFEGSDITYIQAAAWLSMVDAALNADVVRTCDDAIADIAALLNLAPEKPTDEMLRAGVNAFQHVRNFDDNDTLKDWRAFYEAAVKINSDRELNNPLVSAKLKGGE